MFTGIIEKLGKVERAERTDASLRMVVETGWKDLAPGESVAVNGTCLTVAELDGTRALFFASAETLALTNLGSLEVGSSVNLERALQVGARLSGHWVQGHVDGLARFTGARAVGEARELEFELPGELSRYCVKKGSIALDGISLTINHLVDFVDPAPASGAARSRLKVMIIPHTWEHTNLSRLAPGCAVNVEVDVLAKYAERIHAHSAGANS